MLKLYDKYLEPDDLVGYYGLGDGWIFDVQPKGDDDTTAAALRQQIVDSVEKRGAVYLPISPYNSLYLRISPDSVEKRGAPQTRTREPEPGPEPKTEPDTGPEPEPGARPGREP